MTTIDDCKAALAAFSARNCLLLGPSEQCNYWAGHDGPCVALAGFGDDYETMMLLREALAELAAERGEAEGAISSEWWSNVDWNSLEWRATLPNGWAQVWRTAGSSQEDPTLAIVWAWRIGTNDLEPRDTTAEGEESHARPAMRRAAEAVAKGIGCAMNPTPIGWRNPGPQVSPLVQLGRLLGCYALPVEAHCSGELILRSRLGRSIAKLQNHAIFAEIGEEIAEYEGIPGIEAITDPDEAVAFAIKALEARGVKP